MKLIFTLTCGRTGTAYLTDLLAANVPNARVFHEILSYGSFGFDAPDVSHLHAFNARGNVPHVQEFWRRKLKRIEACDRPIYAETSHVLMKAGLVENLAELAPAHEVHFVVLQRDIVQTLVSYRNRFDFTNAGNMWLWYLDPGYPRNKVDPKPFLPHGVLGIRLWYIYEIRSRAALYRQAYAGRPNWHFHDADLAALSDRDSVASLLGALGAPAAASDVVIPPRQNASRNPQPVSDAELSHMRALIRSLAPHAGPYLKAAETAA
jgi:hypothetical protein